MKKRIAVLMACLMMVAGAGSAFAQDLGQESADSGAAVVQEEAGTHVHKLRVLKQFQDELRDLNDGRIDRLENKSQVLEKREQAVTLAIAAADRKDKDALKEAAEVRRQIADVNKQLAGMAGQFRDQLKAFREAAKAGNTDVAKVHIDGAIAILDGVNAKLEQKALLLDQIIQILTPEQA